MQTNASKRATAWKAPNNSMQLPALRAAADAGRLTAWAQKKESGNNAFDAIDKNRDGYLSKEEVAGDEELAKRFARFDAEKDGR